MGTTETMSEGTVRNAVHMTCLRDLEMVLCIFVAKKHGSRVLLLARPTGDDTVHRHLLTGQTETEIGTGTEDLFRDLAPLAHRPHHARP